MSGDVLAQILAQLTTIEASQATVEAGQDKLRIELTERMSQLQDTATQQSRDITALLELMASNQQATQQTGESSQRAVSVGTSNTAILTDLLKRVRQLEADMREMKDQAS
jgi:hypothetical protein